MTTNQVYATFDFETEPVVYIAGNVAVELSSPTITVDLSAPEASAEVQLSEVEGELGDSDITVDITSSTVQGELHGNG